MAFGKLHVDKNTLAYQKGKLSQQRKNNFLLSSTGDASREAAVLATVAFYELVANL